MRRGIFFVLRAELTRRPARLPLILARRRQNRLDGAKYIAASIVIDRRENFSLRFLLPEGSAAVRKKLQKLYIAVVTTFTKLRYSMQCVRNKSKKNLYKGVLAK